MHISFFILTREVQAANNRGESLGNTTTLQKVNTLGGPLTVISGGSIRYAIRDAMLASGATMWREHGACETPSGYGYGKERTPFQKSAAPNQELEKWDDAELFGFFIPQGTGALAVKRTASMSISDALSTTPYPGDRGFGQGVSETNVSKIDENKNEKTKARTGTDKDQKTQESKMLPYNFEKHVTRYHFTVTINLTNLKNPKAVGKVLSTLGALTAGGNHTAHKSELIPAAIIARVHKTPGCGLPGLIESTDKVTSAEDLFALAKQKLGASSDVLRPWAGFRNWTEAETWARQELKTLGVPL